MNSLPNEEYFFIYLCTFFLTKCSDVSAKLFYVHVHISSVLSITSQSRGATITEFGDLLFYCSVCSLPSICEIVLDAQVVEGYTFLQCFLHSAVCPEDRRFQTIVL